MKERKSSCSVSYIDVSLFVIRSTITRENRQVNKNEAGNHGVFLDTKKSIPYTSHIKNRYTHDMKARTVLSFLIRVIIERGKCHGKNI